MTRAAEELHIAQPSLSKAILKLEEELGVPLFDRVGRQIKLNNYGKAFFNRVDRIFLELEDGKRELLDMSKNESSEISIAANNVGPFFKILEGYLKLYPNTLFRQTIGSTIKMQQQLQNREVDFCISSPPIEGDFIECIPLATEEIFLIVPIEHKFAKYKEVNLIEAADCSFISLKEGFGIRDLTERLCHEAGFKPNITFETDVSANLMELVNANMGVALLPILQWNDTQQNKSVPIHIKEPICNRKICLSFIKGRYLTSAAMQFKDYLIDYFKEI
jgi:DNA-binding transcriptional LysR family regulator